jgi:hypothetical protein
VPPLDTLRKVSWPPSTLLAIDIEASNRNPA